MDDWCISCGAGLRGLEPESLCTGCKAAMEAAEMEEFELGFVEIPEDFAVRAL